MANRAAGRPGMGAVMGSKNLKAVVASSHHKRLHVADGRRLNELAKKGPAALPNNPDMAGLKEHGTASVLSFQNATGTLPTRNYNEGQFEDFEPISGEGMTETILVDRDTSYACCGHCKRVVQSEWHGQPIHRNPGAPEYQTLATFTSTTRTHA